jgi:hypothetical protein
MKALNNAKNSSAENAGEPQTSPATPEEIVEQLRAIRESITDSEPLTPQQRRAMRNHLTKFSPDVMRAQISVIANSTLVEEAVNQDAGDVRQMIDEANRWWEVENAIKALLAGVSGANLVRQQKLALVAARGYRVGVSLATIPEHVDLVPHVQEVRRLKRLARRKKPATPESPAPSSAGM